MPFATLAVPFDAYRDLPTTQHRWVLMCLARYCDRDGRCWPSMRRLAADARMSLATVCRYLRSLCDLGVFQRERTPGRCYRYRLADAYVPRWGGGVSRPDKPVPQDGNPKKSTHKKYEYVKNPVALGHADLADDASRWDARLRSWRKSGFWLSFWGPKPNEPGCFAPIV